MIPFDWNRIEEAYQALLARSIESVADLEVLLLDRGALDAQVLEEEAQIYDRTKVNTADEEAKRKYRSFCEEVQPGADELQSQLDRKIVESTWAADLEPRTHAVLLRNLRAAVKSFRPENVSLTTRELVLEASHGECIGAMSVELDGETLTLPATEARLESPDADTRRRAWVAVASRRLEDAGHIDKVFDGLVKLRDRMGRNAGFAGYTGLAFQNKRRFDYTPADCEAFHAGVREHFVPLQSALWEERRAQHGLQSLGPWDLRMSCDVGEPLAPFVHGFSLHAAVRISNSERERLEHLCRYIARPPLAAERLTLTARGRVRYEFRRPWRDGTTHVEFEPLVFLERLAALVPPPRMHLQTYHGVLAPGSTWRDDVVPVPVPMGERTRSKSSSGREQGPGGSTRPPHRYLWAELMRRVFDVEVLRCGVCHSLRRLIAVITQRHVITKILAHLGLETDPPPVQPARAPPQPELAF